MFSVDLGEMARQGVPIGRPGQAEDVAGGVLFLASDASSHQTSAELVIDGGMTRGSITPLIRGEHTRGPVGPQMPLSREAG